VCAFPIFLVLKITDTSMGVSCNEKTMVCTTVQRSEYKINKHQTTHTRYEQMTVLVLMQVQYVCSVL